MLLNIGGVRGEMLRASAAAAAAAAAAATAAAAPCRHCCLCCPVRSSACLIVSPRRPTTPAAVVTQDKCLLFEPNSPSSRKFLEIVMPKIQAAGQPARSACAAQCNRAAQCPCAAAVIPQPRCPLRRRVKNLLHRSPHVHCSQVGQLDLLRMAPRCAHPAAFPILPAAQWRPTRDERRCAA